MHMRVVGSSPEDPCCTAELHVVRCNDLLAAGTGALDMLSCVTSLRRLYVNGLPTLVDVEVLYSAHGARSLAAGQSNYGCDKRMHQRHQALADTEVETIVLAKCVAAAPDGQQTPWVQPVPSNHGSGAGEDCIWGLQVSVGRPSSSNRCDRGWACWGACAGWRSWR